MTYLESFAAVGLFIATIALVWVTVHHARHAAKLAAAADRLGATLENRGMALEKAIDLHTLVTALAARHTGQWEALDHQPRQVVEGIVVDLMRRYSPAEQPNPTSPPTQS